MFLKQTAFETGFQWEMCKFIVRVRYLFFPDFFKLKIYLHTIPPHANKSLNMTHRAFNKTANLISCTMNNNNKASADKMSIRGCLSGGILFLVLLQIAVCTCAIRLKQYWSPPPFCLTVSSGSVSLKINRRVLERGTVLICFISCFSCVKFLFTFQSARFIYLFLFLYIFFCASLSPAWPISKSRLRAGGPPPFISPSSRSPSFCTLTQIEKDLP